MERSLHMRQSTICGWAIGLLVLWAAGTGCQNKLYEENMALHRQNNELQAKLRESDNRTAQAPDNSSQLATMQQEIASRDQRSPTCRRSSTSHPPTPTPRNPTCSRASRSRATSTRAR